MTYLATFERSLSERGWANLNVGECDTEILSMTVRKIADELGVIIRGRRGADIERLESVSTDEARLPSLSAAYGNAEFPLHMDTAHQPVPCRYLVLGCVSANQTTAATRLLDTAELAFTADEIDSLKTGIFLVKNGGHSFFAPILSSDRRFFRWDPGCITAKDELARTALSIFERRLRLSKSVRHEWQSGSVLVLDNWRMLHGRECCVREDTRRTLLRSSVYER
jgi:alpha-ketoglutarate-dependent taurine dioxygenase